MEKFLEILLKVNDIPLVSTCETVFLAKFVALIQGYLPRYSIQKIDNNLILIPSRKNSALVFFAHMDEIGFVTGERLGKNQYRLGTKGLVDKLAAHGQMVQTFLNEKKYVGVIGNLLPHARSSTTELIAEFVENIDLPPGYPVQWFNQLIATPEYIFSKTIDNHGTIASFLRIAMEKDMCMVFASGEEEGEQNLRGVVQFLKKSRGPQQFLVVDVCPSDDDPYYKNKTHMREGTLGVAPIEGGGTGNKAPQQLVDFLCAGLKASGIPLSMITTNYPDEITDATQLYHEGEPAISLGYPLRYCHNPVEVAHVRTFELLHKFLREI